MTFQPVAGALLRAGGYKVFDSSNIPNQIMDVLVVRRDAIPDYSRQLQVLVNGYFSARQSMNSNRQVALTMMSKRSGIAKEHLIDAYKGLHLPTLEENRIWLDRCGQFMGRRIQELSELMKAHDLIDMLPDNNLICNATWVNSVKLQNMEVQGVSQ